MAPKVYDMVLEVFEGEGLPPTLNDTFLVLIPKRENPELPSQFRPIGLCNECDLQNHHKGHCKPHKTFDDQTNFLHANKLCSWETNNG